MHATARSERVREDDAMTSTAESAPDGAERTVRLRGSDQIARIQRAPVVGGWTLEVGGREQSHVDLEDPRRVIHEYLRRIANVLDTFRPAGEPISIAHLGAGAFTLARYVQASRPGSVQVGVEIERELPTFVTSALPLPDGTDLEIRIGDARDELTAMGERRFDAIVLDVFSGEESPAHLTTRDFYLDALQHLDAEGVLLVNVGDDAGQRFLTQQIHDLDAATSETGLSGVWTLSDATLVSEPRDGNVILAAGPALTRPDVQEQRQRWVQAGPHPAAVLDPEETMAAFTRRE